MKKIYVLSFLMLGYISFAQQFSNDFEDGTLQEWTNNDGSTDQLTIEVDDTSHYFKKVADGTNSPTGEMMIINESSEYWAGNYFYSPTGGSDEAMISVDEIVLRNTNNFNLYIRYGFTGSNGGMVYTTEPIVVPALSDWDIYTNSYFFLFPTMHNITIVNDVSGLTLPEVFSFLRALFMDVTEFRIYSSQTPSFEAEVLTGTLEIDTIFSFMLLANEDNGTLPVTLFPNPAEDIITIGSQTPIHAYRIYSVTGALVIEGKLENNVQQMDVSQLNSGMYFLQLNSGNHRTTQKFIKK